MGMQFSAIFFFREVGVVSQEEESRDFHSIIYSKQAVVTVVIFVVSMILLMLWE